MPGLEAESGYSSSARVYKTVSSVTAELAHTDAGGVLLAMLLTVVGQRDPAMRPWTGSWTGAPDNPRVVSAVSAMIRWSWVPAPPAPHT